MVVIGVLLFGWCMALEAVYAAHRYKILAQVEQLQHNLTKVRAEKERLSKLMQQQQAGALAQQIQEVQELLEAARTRSPHGGPAGRSEEIAVLLEQVDQLRNQQQEQHKHRENTLKQLQAQEASLAAKLVLHEPEALAFKLWRERLGQQQERLRNNISGMSPAVQARFQKRFAHTVRSTILYKQLMVRASNSSAKKERLAMLIAAYAQQLLPSVVTVVVEQRRRLQARRGGVWGSFFYSLYDPAWRRQIEHDSRALLMRGTVQYLLQEHAQLRVTDEQAQQFFAAALAAYQTPLENCMAFIVSNCMRLI